MNREPGMEEVLNYNLSAGIKQNDHLFYFSEGLLSQGWPWEMKEYDLLTQK